MAMGRPLTPLALSASARAQLESMAQSRSLPHGWVRRAEIVLLAAEGWPHEAVAAAVGVTRATVGKWRRRFLENGLHGLHDELRSGAPRSITDEQVAEVVYKTLKTKPQRPNPVVGALHGRGNRPHQGRGASHRAHVWFAAPPTQALQAFHRSFLGRQSTGYRRLIHASPRARPGFMRRREEPDPGVGTKSAPVAPGPGLRGRGYARLQAPWHHHSVCRPGRGHR